MPGSRAKILDHVFAGLCARINRRKKIADDSLDLPLRRPLCTADLAMLGIGSMVSVGVYVVAGVVARNVAGPAVVLCFLIAGLSALLGSMSYAELSANHPRAGSGYAYVYASLGEMWAFLIGWNLVLEHIIGVAALGRAWSGLVDSLTAGAMHNLTRMVLGKQGTASVTLLHGSLGNVDVRHDAVLHVAVDPLALVAVLFGCALLATRGSPWGTPWGWTWGSTVWPLLGGALVVLNMAVIGLFVVLCFINADLRNWGGKGMGDFTPFGIDSLLVGAAMAAYAFSGVEAVSAAGQNSRRPGHIIPPAGMLSCACALSAYLLLATALTLAVPYNSIDSRAALPYVLGRLFGQDADTPSLAWVCRWVVGLGGILAVSAGLVAPLVAAPRMAHALSLDGLLPCPARPTTGLVLAGLASGLLAASLELSTLVELLSAGTLLSQLAINCAVIASRYRPPPGSSAASVRADETDLRQSPSGLTDDSDTLSVASELASPVSPTSQVSAWNVIALGRVTPVALPVAPGEVRSSGGCARCLRTLGLHSWRPGALVGACLLTFLVVASFMFLVARGGLASYTETAIVFLCLGCLVVLILVVHAHEQIPVRPGAFRAPMVPLMPACAILMNMQLLMHLPGLAWLRCAAWTALGVAIYFLYGIRHSAEAERRSTYSVLVGGGGAAKGAGAGVSAPPAPATGRRLHAPQPSPDKMPILDHEDLND